MDVIRKLWWGLYPLSNPQLRPIIYILGLCIMWSYWAVATVGVWRSANLYAGDNRIGPIAAKCVVLFDHRKLRVSFGQWRCADICRANDGKLELSELKSMRI